MKFCIACSLLLAGPSGGGLPPELVAVADSHRAVADRVSVLDGYVLTQTATHHYADLTGMTTTLVSYPADAFLRETVFSGDDADGYSGSVDALPPGYVYRLENRRGGPWRMVRYAVVDRADLDMKSIGFPFSYRRPSGEKFDTGYRVSVAGLRGSAPLSVPNLIDGNTIRNAKAVQSDDGRTDRFTFERRRRDGTWSDITLDVESGGDRLPVRLVESDGKTTVETRVEYADGDDRLARVLQRQAFTGPAGEAEITVETTLDRRVPEPGRFLVSHYGFPEPAELATASRRPAAFWLLPLTGVLLVGGGVWLRGRA